MITLASSRATSQRITSPSGLCAAPSRCTTLTTDGDSQSSSMARSATSSGATMRRWIIQAGLGRRSSARAHHVGDRALPERLGVDEDVAQLALGEHLARRHRSTLEVGRHGRRADASARSRPGRARRRSARTPGSAIVRLRHDHVRPAGDHVPRSGRRPRARARSSRRRSTRGSWRRRRRPAGSHSFQRTRIRWRNGLRHRPASLPRALELRSRARVQRKLQQIAASIRRRS